MAEPSTAEELARELRAAIGHGSPWVTLTWAQSLDGSIAERRGVPTAISGAESLVVTHRMRSAHDAILVGAGTVRSDDPRLTTRFVEGRSPRPIVMDRHLHTPPTARLFEGGDRSPIFFCSSEAYQARGAALTAAGAVCEVVDDSPRPMLRTVLDRLFSHGIESVMVEGGGEVLAAFLAAGLADLVVVTIAPVVLGGYRPPFRPITTEGAANGLSSALTRLVSPRYYPLGEDLVVCGGFA